MAVLFDRFNQEIAPQLREQYKYKSPMQIPRLAKIIINMGLGEAIQNVKILDSASAELSQISGQKPVITRARLPRTEHWRHGHPFRPIPSVVSHY
ncbi:MAG TPA: 50S ribosomal protein L5 [Chloroflexi bacterium]|nr:50S ribosomal protein L5 [Chloroflexota bacterium]